MNHEHSQSPRKIDIVELSEIDFSLLTPSELYELLLELAKKSGIDPDSALYVGFDADFDDPLNNGFGGRTTTWAFTSKEYEQAARQDTAIGQHGTKSPIFYATTGALDPTVLILDGAKFENALDEGHTDLEYRLKSGIDFEDAVVAALRIES